MNRKSESKNGDGDSLMGVLQQLKSGPVSEENGKALFQHYSKNGHEWTVPELRAFLKDLQSAFDYARAVPDELLDLVLQELQLHIEVGGNVSWVEFKSFLILQSESPLTFLHQKLALFGPPQYPFTLYVPSLPVTITKQQLLNLFGDNLQTLYQTPIEQQTTQALIVLKNSAAVSEVIKSKGEGLLKMSDGKAIVRLYNKEEFPSPGERAAPSTLAKALAPILAPVIMVGQKIEGGISQGVTTVDDKLKISSTLKKTTDSVSGFINNFDDKHKISHSLRTTAGKISTSLKLKERVERAGQTARRASQEVSRLPPVQAVGGFFSKIGDKFENGIKEIKQETKYIVAEKKSRLSQAYSAPAQPAQLAPAPAPTSTSTLTPASTVPPWQGTAQAI